MRPEPIDAVDAWILKTQPQIGTALELAAFRSGRRLHLDVVLEAARLLVDDYRNPARYSYHDCPDGYDPEPIPY